MLRLIDAGSEGGRSACVVEIGPWLTGADELGIQSAVTGLADTALSYASTAATPGHLNVTLGLQVDFWRDPPPPGSRLTAAGLMQMQQGAVTLVHGQILLGDEILATASLRSMATPMPVARALPTGEAAPPVEPPSATADLAAAERAATGDDPVPAAPRIGVPAPAHLLQRISADDQPGDLAAVLALELATMCDTELVDVADGLVELRVVPPAAFERTVGVVHGGAVAALGQLAGAGAAQSALANGVRPRRLGVTIDYLRPTIVGEPLVIRAVVSHRSRRVILTDIDIFTDDGRRTARILERSVIDGP
jgi:uncharacterized protein (TIGR00369 family)